MRPSASKARRSISLVVVLPALPVTAMILALLRARAARARSSRPRWVWATVSSGPVTPSGACDDQRRARLGIKSGAHEIMAVAIVALQRHEQVAFLQRAGVDGKPVHGKRCAGLAQRGGFGFGGVHRLMPRALPARWPRSPLRSRSEKGMHLAVDILAGLMALAGHHQHIAGFQCGDRGANGFVPGRRSRARPALPPEFRGGWRRGLRCGDCRR